MANSNITEVRLLSVPLENDYQHTLYFETAAAQETYFKNQTIKSGSDFSYQRKENLIRYPAHFDDLVGCNYVMYKNANYSGKWFYAFIKKMEYVNDGNTNIFIETDVIQTWLFDYELKKSFVEREHVDSDGLGAHTVPERLELGEYICNKHSKAGYCDETDLLIVVGSTRTPDGEQVNGKLYNNIYSGINYYTFANTQAGANELQEWLASFSGDGAADAITCMFLAPKRLTDLRDDHTTVGSNFIDTHYINGDESLSINSAIDMTDGTLDGYTPKNKKLLCYPYRYLLVSNNAGCSVPFQYEQFKQTVNGVTAPIDPQFKIEGCLTPGTSIRMIPLNYKGIGRNDEEGINLGKFPCLNWTSDVYTNWLTQNGVNIAISAVGGLATIAGGIGLIATGAGAIAGAGAITSGILGVASSVGEVYSHSLQPPQAQGNINSGDIVTASGNNDFHFYDMSIKREYAAIIDNYFSMYGYKVNQLKKPNFAHRANYWYTKTIDANIAGAIPMDDLQKIKECYNRGITFWKNTTNIRDYSVDNSIL